MNLGEMLWQRGSARSILYLARRRFRGFTADQMVRGYILMASVHYSLIKRYTSWWNRGWGAYHAYRAAYWANRTVAHVRKVGGLRQSDLTANELDVLSTVLGKTPWLLGGDRDVAKDLAGRALSLPGLKIDTQALLQITIANILLAEGNRGDALIMIWNVYDSIDKVEDQRQRVRIRFGVGSFLVENAGREMMMHGVGFNLVEAALSEAEVCALDQVKKIQAWIHRHTES